MNAEQLLPLHGGWGSQEGGEDGTREPPRGMRPPVSIVQGSPGAGSAEQKEFEKSRASRRLVWVIGSGEQAS